MLSYRSMDKIKISFCSIADKKGKIEEIIPKVAEAGYTGVEIWEPHLNRFVSEGGQVKQIKDILSKHLLEAPVVSSYFTFMGGDEKYRQSLEHARHLAGICGEINCPYIRVLIDWVGSKDATPEQWEKGIKGLQDLSAIGEDHGVGFVIETDACQLFDSTASTGRLLTLVDRKNIKVNLDIYNLFLAGEDPVNSLDKLFSQVCHIHLKNGIIQGNGIKSGIYMNSGNMDYKPFFSRLRTIGYQGFLSVEWFGDSIWEAAEHECKYIRSMLTTG